jgi:hypothetical protein
MCTVEFIIHKPPPPPPTTFSSISVADQDPGSGAFWPQDRGSGMGKNPDPGPGMNIPDNFSESLETGSGSGIRYLFDAGSGIQDGKIRIRDKHPGSVTLTYSKK